ncbi:MAG: glycerophosphodiester phosphodiesterase [Flavobacterium sp.]|nr:MAG: glycerophosphodiester phosphodiesterase [Flavobacterium sp.]
MLKIGHRGAKAHEDENTLESFAKAIGLGATGIELDVHVCATGELVVIHDFTVDRTTNGTGEVSRLSLSRIKELKTTGGYSVPLLEEVLDLAGTSCLINIEMKGRHTAQPVAKIVQDYVEQKGYSYSDFIVSSFQHEELVAISKINPQIHLGVLTQANINEAMEVAAEVSAKAIHPHFSLLTEHNIKKARDAGYKIFTWTVNDHEDIARVKLYKPDGIISDYPERL